MINIINLGAACAIIDVYDTRILMDPWFTPGAYLGCWERESFIADPIGRIGRVEYIWISHLHEDHYDPAFIRSYLLLYPDAKLIIGGTYPEYLHKIMKRDGLDPLVQNHLRFPGGELFSVINHGYELSNVDTALVVRTDTHAVVNMNDNPFDQKQVDIINDLIQGRHVTALLPYSGAGPWPQCFGLDEEALQRATALKRAKFLGQFLQYKDALHANVAVPFSAGYRLIGPLAALNEHRGIPPVDAVVGGTPLPVQTDERPDWPFSGYHWENSLPAKPGELDRLLDLAIFKAPKVGESPLSVRLCWGHASRCLSIGTLLADNELVHETITLDARLLKGLLERRYHWNTVEISSALQIRRRPGGAYTQRVFEYLNRFHT